MPGRLRSSFRTGNLAEHLGLLLLKGIAAVAEVSRQEDVGLDAIATLLRRDNDGNCYAEDTFVVQVKSASATTIEYRGHELDWLLGQSQPMFIGLVEMASSRVSLYPTIYINQAVWALDIKCVTAYFGRSERSGFLGTCRHWAGRGGEARVWLGEPLVEWSLGDLSNHHWQTTTYAILKRFLSIVIHEYELISLGQTTDIAWTTNDIDSIRIGARMMKGHPDDLRSLAQRAVPILRALMLYALPWPSHKLQNEEAALIVPLLKLNAELRKFGADADPHDMYAILLADSLKSAAEDGLDVADPQLG